MCEHGCSSLILFLQRKPSPSYLKLRVKSRVRMKKIDINFKTFQWTLHESSISSRCSGNEARSSLEQKTERERTTKIEPMDSN